MTIEANELALFRATRNSDQSNNGGRVSLTTIASGVRNGIFSDLESGAGLANQVQARKVFIKQNLNAIEDSAYNTAFVYLKDIGDDDVYIELAYGTETDTQATPDYNAIMTGRVESVNSGANTVNVDTTQAKNGTIDLVRWRQSDQTMVVVENVTSANIGGNIARLSGLDVSQFQPGDVVTQRVYAQSGDTADQQNLAPRALEPAIISGGTLDRTLITFAPRAAISFTISLTFLNTQSFTYSIPSLGLTGTGSVADDLVINHPDSVSNSVNDRMLTIPASAWGGSFTNASRVTLQVISGSIPVWLRRVINNSPTISGQQNVNFSLDYQTS